MRFSDEPLTQRYARYCVATAREPMPFALVDEQALMANVDRVRALAERAQKPIRIATKSIRSVALLRLIAARLGAMAGGFMCYSMREAAMLADAGLRDLLVAYPSTQPADLAAFVRAASAGAAMCVDDVRQVHALADAAAAAGCVFDLVVDADTALRLSPTLHFGARRSSAHSVAAALTLAQAIAGLPSLRFRGVMTYEAHIAGLPDRNPFTPRSNLAKRLFKATAARALRKKREALLGVLASAGLTPGLRNGAGTGSLLAALADPTLNEVTVGSGFLGSHLFDYYSDSAWEPAACFAVAVTRQPDARWITVAGGGYIASGEAGRDRAPLPYLPAGLSLSASEGVGEVQTPLLVRDAPPALGAPVFFRHAKAGELAEHFNRYLLIDGEEVVTHATTYRGDGFVF